MKVSSLLFSLFKRSRLFRTSVAVSTIWIFQQRFYTNILGRFKIFSLSKCLNCFLENIFTVQTILLFCLKNLPFSSNFTIRLHQVSGRRGTTTTTEQNPASETWVNLTCILLFTVNLIEFDFISCYYCGWCCFPLPLVSGAAVLSFWNGMSWNLTWLNWNRNLS